MPEQGPHARYQLRTDGLDPSARCAALVDHGHFVIAAIGWIKGAVHPRDLARSMQRRVIHRVVHDLIAGLLERTRVAPKSNRMSSDSNGLAAIRAESDGIPSRRKPLQACRDPVRALLGPSRYEKREFSNAAFEARGIDQRCELDRVHRGPAILSISSKQARYTRTVQRSSVAQVRTAHAADASCAPHPFSVLDWSSAASRRWRSR